MNLSAELDRWLPPAARDVLVRIGACATELGCRAYLVGGPVRDLLLGRASYDLDVVVEGDAPTVARAATPAEGATPVVHPAFGTATIHAGAFRIDLATARDESYERPGALPTVRPGTVEQDLLRRDFTVNAMALTLDGRRRGDLVDLYGGRSDLAHGLLRVLHEASFVDDATRILRGVRYEQRFGFTFERRTLRLLQRDVCFLDSISGDRLRHEFERTFVEDEPEQALLRLDAFGALGIIHPAVRCGPNKAEALVRGRPFVTSDVQLATFCWCVLVWGMSVGEAEALGTRLNLPRRVMDPLADAVALFEVEVQLDDPGLSPAEVFDLLHDHSPAALVAAEHLFVRPVARANVSRYLRRLRHVRPALCGRDLQELGIPEGPLLGRVLSAIRAARLNGEVSTRRDEELLALRLQKEGH